MFQVGVNEGLPTKSLIASRAWDLVHLMSKNEIYNHTRSFRQTRIEPDGQNVSKSITELNNQVCLIQSNLRPT